MIQQWNRNFVIASTELHLRKIHSLRGGRFDGKSLQKNIKCEPDVKTSQLLQAPAALSIRVNPASVSQQRVMPSKFNLQLLSAVLLAAALLRRASGAPLEDAPTDGPAAAGDTSGEEEDEGEEASYLVGSLDMLKTWEKVIGQTNTHQKKFEEEFQGNVDYLFLENYKHSSFPAECPDSNFSKDACLQRLVQGLLVYRVLLKHVEREYPNSPILQMVNPSICLLIPQIRKKMRNGDRVTALSSSQEEQLLKELNNNPDAFHRKMTAHSILYNLRLFLIDGKRSFRKWEMPIRRTAHTNGALLVSSKGEKI
ncbi:interleukin-6 [Leuresthes tenuis]|uniref:interleukin-6 n=1 Tax=Leuresthes tenuis TaxID=355514 RepID=UPI003B511AFB